jgi:hypothetical protein
MTNMGTSTRCCNDTSFNLLFPDGCGGAGDFSAEGKDRFGSKLPPTLRIPYLNVDDMGGSSGAHQPPNLTIL